MTLKKKQFKTCMLLFILSVVQCDFDISHQPFLSICTQAYCNKRIFLCVQHCACQYYVSMQI